MIRKNNGALLKKDQSLLFEYIVSSVLRLKLRSEIIQNSPYPVSDRCIDKYIRRAKDLIASSPERNAKELLQEHIAIREQLYRDAKRAHDKLAIADSIAKLQGLEKRIVNIKYEGKSQAENVTTEKLIEIVQDQDSDKDAGEEND